MVGITGMDEHLVIFLEPGVHLVPVEGDVVLQVGPLGLQVAPGGFFGDTISHLDRVETCLTPAGMRAGEAGGYEQILADVLGREVVDGQPLLLQHQHHPATVGDGDPAEHHAHAPLGRFEENPVVRDGPLT